MKLTVNLTGAEDVRRKLLQIGQQAGTKALAAAAEDVELYVHGEAGKHTKTGALGRSVYLRKLGDGYEVGHDPRVAPHALFVHWGTRPHKIKPKDKRALRWAAGGQFAFAKVVHHPGYKGDAWLVRAAALAPAIFERHVNAAISRITGA